MRTSFLICFIYLSIYLGLAENRELKQLSVFSVVQFPNDECVSSSSTSTNGTCYTSSECTAKGGSASGSCAAGFGVCCVISTSTCGATISTNTSYIRNPGYPSTYSPTSAGTCVFNINKCSDDICQLRLDFETFTGYAVDTVTAGIGACTDTFAAVGDSGVNPPTICGTNTGYHMYVEFGANSGDTVTITNTLSAAGTYSWNILARQISCTAAWKAPTNCVQYFTGISDTVQNYNFGGQMLQAQSYENCIRTADGYCRIMWQESSAATPDSFQLDTQAGAVSATGAGAATACALAFVTIPDASPDGVSPLPIPPNTLGFQSTWCGGNLGFDGVTGADGVNGMPLALVSAQKPFTLGFNTLNSNGAADIGTGNGFSLDYTQLPC